MNRNKFLLNPVNTDDCPCKDCKPPKRSSTCHADCIEYKQWEEDHKSKLQKLNKQKESKVLYYEGAARRNKSLTERGMKGK